MALMTSDGRPWQAAAVGVQALEQVLDKGRLSIGDASAAGGADYAIEKKPGFRLFATQNPNTGHFRGKREQLSDSLTSR
jgi:hypothetical protein